MSVSMDHVTFHYIKSAFFRVIHTDGVLGGATPQGHIHIAVFSERPAIPQVATHKLVVNGDSATLGEEIERVGKEGIVRELETDLLMTREVAQRLYSWLGERLSGLGALPGQTNTPEPGAAGHPNAVEAK
jgi:hypothetical protein